MYHVFLSTTDAASIDNLHKKGDTIYTRHDLTSQ